MRVRSVVAVAIVLGLLSPALPALAAQQEASTDVASRPAVGNVPDPLSLETFADAAVSPTTSTAQPPGPPIAGVEDDPESPLDLTAVDEQAAKALAASSGRRVKVLNSLTASSTVYANPNGLFTARLYGGVVHVRQPKGDWADVNLNVVPRGDRIGPAVAYGNPTFSPGGDAALAMQTRGDATVRFDWPEELPAPLATGAEVAYRDVRPATDLLLRALPTGFEIRMVLRERPADEAPIYRFPLTLPPGWRVESDGAGYRFVDDEGGQAGTISPTVMFGATVDAATGNPARQTTVESAIESDVNGALQLVLRPSAAFLSDPTVAYPVTVDPAVNLADTIDTYVDSHWADTPYGSKLDLHVGHYYDAAQNYSALTRSFIGFNPTSIHGKYVQSATLKLYLNRVWNCSSQPQEVWSSAAPNSSTTWNTQPTMYNRYAIFSTQDVGETCSLGRGWVQAGVTSLVDAWSKQTNSTNYLGLRASNESDNNQYHKYASANAGSSVTPVISVTYANPPSAPTSPAAAAADMMCTVTWGAPTSDGGASIDQYKVNMYRYGLTGAQMSVTTLAGVRKYVFSGLTNGYDYAFYIYAHNAAGDSPSARAPSSGYCHPSGKPLAPTNVDASADATTTSVVWGAAPTNGSPITGYEVKRKNVTLGTWDIATTHAASDRSHVGDPAVTGYQYQYSVLATNANGRGPEALSDIVTCGISGDPRNVTASGGDQRVTIRWSNPANDGPPLGPSVTSYTVNLYRTVDGSPTLVATRSDSATAREHVFGPDGTPVANGSTYYGTVTAVTANGVSKPVNSNEVVAGPALPPRDAVARAEDSSVSVSWDRPANDGPANGGPAVVSYTVRLYKADGTLVGAKTVSADTFSDSRAATNGTQYYFTVTATTDYNGTSAPAQSNAVVAGLPSAVRSLAAVPGDSELTVTWVNPANDGTANGGPAVTGYVIELYVDEATGLALETVTPPATARSHRFTQLANGSRYVARIWATSANGPGPASDIGPTLVATVPEAPTDVAATETPSRDGSTSATVTFVLGYDGGAPIDKCTVRAFDAARLSDPPVAQTTVLGESCNNGSAVVVGLAYNTTYVFDAAAHNSSGVDKGQGAGWSAWSDRSDPLTTGSPAVVTKTAAGVPVMADRGQVITYTITVTNTSASNLLRIENLTDVFSPGFDPGPSPVTATRLLPAGPSYTCSEAQLSCSYSRTRFEVTSLDLEPQMSREFTLQGVLTGAPSSAPDSDRVCSALVNTVHVTDPYRIGAVDADPVTTCNGALGLEPWWTYVTQPVAATTTAATNVANGNLVVTATDSTPIQAHGHLTHIVRRSYNSQDTSLETLPASFGRGWMLNLGQSDDLAAAGVTAQALAVPRAGELLHAITAPLPVTLIDRDGTRHMFSPRIGLPGIDVTALSPDSSPTAPRALTPPTGTHVCIDVAYDAPPGVHLGMWRYVAVTSASAEPCAPSERSASEESSVVLGFAAVRPDRLRTEFDAQGRLVSMVDGAGGELRYEYNRLSQPTRVFEPSCAGTCRETRIDYYDSTGNRLDETSLGTLTDIARAVVTDAAGRPTTYTFTLDGSGGRLLKRVDNGAGRGSVNFTYQGEMGVTCGGSPGQLCSIQDERGHTSTFSYDAAGATSPALGRGRIAAMTDRRPAHYPTQFSYSDSSSQPGSSVTVTRPALGNAADRANTDRQAIYGPIDHTGRVEQLLEGARGLTVSTSRRVTQWTWDGTRSDGSSTPPCRSTGTANFTAPDNNLCQLTRRGSADWPTTETRPTPDEVTAYVYDDAGMVQRTARTVNASSLRTTQSIERQWWHADGTVEKKTETVAGYGYVAGASPGNASPVLFTIADVVATVTPRGNAGNDWTRYRTAYVVDNVTTAPPNRSPVGGSCAAGVATGNTGLVCRTDRPIKTGVATTSFRYNAVGAVVAQTNPNGGVYKYTYFSDTDRDLSGSTAAGGWLRTIEDPAQKFVAFGYDAAGNVVRTWDRNATSGAGLGDSAYPGTAANPPSTAGGEVPHADTQYATGSFAEAAANPWRYIRQQRDNLGNETVSDVDSAGNVLAVTTPSGNVTRYTYDENNAVLTVLSPEETAARRGVDAVTRFTYDAFGARTTMTSPEQTVSNAATGDSARFSERYLYDEVGRLVESDRVRSMDGTASAGAPCFSNNSGSQLAEPDLPAQAMLCPTIRTYDNLDNLIAVTDASGATTWTEYDAVHRATNVKAPPHTNTTGAAKLRTAYLYDADGNITTACQPRQDSCFSTAVGYVTHYGYDNAGNRETITTFRQSTGSPNTTSVEYDATGNPVKVIDANLHATSYGYDRLDRLTSVTAPRDGALTYTTYHLYDASGNRTATIRPGASSGSPYARPRIAAVVFDADNRAVDTVTGLDVALPDPANPLSESNAVAIRNAARTAIANGTANTRVRQVYDADGRVVAEYDARAFTSSVPPIDAGTPRGAFSSAYMTRTAYDADGRPIQRYVPRTGGSVTAVGSPPPGSPEADQCTSAGPSSAPVYPSGTGVCVTTVNYDADGNIASSGMPTSTPSRPRSVNFTYTPDDLLLSVETPDPSASASGTGRITMTRYGRDGLGRAVSVTDAAGLGTTYTYAPSGVLVEVNRPSGPGGLVHRTSYGYDSDGNRNRVTSWKNSGSDSTYATHTPDNLLAQVDAPGPGTSRNLITYTYDGVGNPASVKSPSANAGDNNNPNGYATTYAYTDDNLLKWMVAPFQPNGTQWRRTGYSYDPAGRKTGVDVDVVGPAAVGQEDPKDRAVVTDGAAQSFGYALNDRLVTQLGRGGSNKITTGYDAAGNMTCVADTTGSEQRSCESISGASLVRTSFYLDGLVRSVVESHRGVGGARSSGFRYDGAGRVTVRTGDAAGGAEAVTTYRYNDAGLPVGMSSSLGAGPTSWVYNVLGQPVAEDVTGGPRRTWRYNLPGDATLAQTTVVSGTTTLADYTYTYDSSYRILTQGFTGALAGGGTTSAVLRYGYDSGGRLTSFTNGSQSAQAITWDHDGNRLTYGAKTFTYNADDSLRTSSNGGLGELPKTMEYDATGRLTNDGCAGFGYDGMDRLVTVSPNEVQLDATCLKTALTYTYDGLDRQETRSEGTGAVTRTAQLFHDGLGSNTSGETFAGGTGTSALDYTFDAVGAPKAVTVTGTGAGVQYLADDGTGSIATITATNGSGVTQVACAVRYDPFGTPVGNNTNTTPSGVCYTGSTYQDYFYRGARRDTASGTYQLGSRTYDPGKGAFLTPDTYRQAPASSDLGVGTDPLTANRYSYVNGDPVNLSDPTGHAPRCNRNEEDCRSLVYRYAAGWGPAAAAIEYYNTEHGSIRPVAALAGIFAGGVCVGGGVVTAGVVLVACAALGGAVTGSMVAADECADLKCGAREVGTEAAIGAATGGAGLLVGKLVRSGGRLVASLVAKSRQGKEEGAVLRPPRVDGTRAAVNQPRGTDRNSQPGRGTTTTAQTTAAAEDAGGGARSLFHYTNEEGQSGILESQRLNPSLKAVNPSDARYGNGQYLSDIEPGTYSNASLSSRFLRNPYQGARFSHYVEIDTTGLDVVEGRPGVFVIPNEEPLDLLGRILSWGKNE